MDTEDTKATEETKRRPVAEMKVGAVRAAIWRNGKTGTPLYNVTLSRLYKDREGRWRDSDSFGRDDLPLVGRAVDMAHDWIYQQRDESES